MWACVYVCVRERECDGALVLCSASVTVTAPRTGHSASVTAPWSTAARSNWPGGDDEDTLRQTVPPRPALPHKVPPQSRPDLPRPVPPYHDLPDPTRPAPTHSASHHTTPPRWCTQHTSLFMELIRVIHSVRD